MVLGVFAYYRYAQSERHFKVAQAKIDAVAPHLTVEECVDLVINWHASCSANKPLCDHGVPRMMTHCLVGRDRTEACANLDLSSSEAKWVFRHCEERQTPCVDRKRCPCADSFRALDSFCRHGQQGVAM